MATNQKYQRLGGVYLSAPDIHAFVNPRRGPVERKCQIVQVDAERFGKFWDVISNQTFKKAAPIDLWSDIARQLTVWRLLEGPRHPIEIPYVFDSGNGLAIATSSRYVRLLLDWGAKTVPVMAAPECIELIKDAAGVEGAEVIRGADFLIDAQETISAFQKGIPLGSKPN